MYHNPKSNAEFYHKDTTPSAQVDRKHHFIFLLLPGANMLDFIAAIEPLRVANSILQDRIYSWATVSENGQSVLCSNGIQFPVDAKIPLTTKSDCVVVCSGDVGYQAATDETLSWLRRHVRFGGTVATLSSGAFTLARAGLVRSDLLTIHWSLIPVFEETFTDLECNFARNTKSEKQFYCAGGISSLDLSLSFIQADFGQTIAMEVAEICLHDFDATLTRIQRQPLSVRVGSRHPAMLKVLERMNETIQSPVSMDEIIKNISISKRQLERLFKRYLDTTPACYYRNIRLDRAQCLIQGTDLSILEIAIATGFSSPTHFSKLYKKRFGVKPGSGRVPPTRRVK